MILQTIQIISLKGTQLQIIYIHNLVKYMIKVWLGMQSYFWFGQSNFQ